VNIPEDPQGRKKWMIDLMQDYGCKSLILGQIVGPDWHLLIVEPPWQ
jgi:hypothetical protein